MAASLLVRIRRHVSFSAVMNGTPAILLQILNLDAAPSLIFELPPAKKNLSLENQMINVNFPGAYIQLQGIDRSLVNFHVFGSPVPGESTRLLLACEASGRGPASEVLVGALAAAAGTLMQGSIDDGGHHWLDQDEYSSEELVERLKLSEDPGDFATAVARVYHREAFHARNLTR